MKIDKLFVDGVAEPGSEAAALVRAILELARTRLSTVAEGIELPEQHGQLAAAGCDWAQGYLFAKPTPPSSSRRSSARAARCFRGLRLARRLGFLAGLAVGEPSQQVHLPTGS